ncbi:MAG: hypothetical protein IKI03_05420 [Clostridia bacterium]|nr:hypothetical protein [Clostridia bacterium]
MGEEMQKGWRISDLSEIADKIVYYHELANSAVKKLEQFHEALRPLVEAVEKNGITHFLQVFAEKTHYVVAIKKLGDAQFVQWSYLSEGFLEEIYLSNNVNKTLRLFVIKKNYRILDETIEKTRNSPSMKNHLRLYNESIQAFLNGLNDVAVNGFTSVFDGLLTEVSNNTTHKLKERITPIVNKLKDLYALDNEEYAIVTLIFTFSKATDLFSSFTDFSEKEPSWLNRHWIAHGRSVRKKTKIDCVKMVFMIYGLLLISELVEKYDETKEN